ncbi:SPOR domain-containing protein [Parathalassolituus penaei]|uniref:SPOR domain-containing protein n=1 Tax=Parathalassolituus penaei TaxID=2997323 RepID=A0A9X3IS89_9GAMM|nr:SPOR domain-containing protein [Parathalassolituus penaei]MCY0966097.1 SPOR domain-containing protein [Parathalassolituus penaei]
MRWIFFSLLIGNMVLMAYYWQKEGTTKANISSQTVELPTTGQRLTLLSETTIALPKAREVDTNGRRRCYLLGPYGDEIDSRHAAARSQALGLTGRSIYTEIPSGEPEEYWVYIPPRPSRDAAVRILKEMQKRGFDSFIITKGELAEGVSLGVFRNQDSAVQLADQVREFNSQVAVKQVTKTRREFWLEIPEGPEVNQGLRDRVQADDSKASWQLSECSVQ